MGIISFIARIGRSKTVLCAIAILLPSLLAAQPEDPPGPADPKETVLKFFRAIEERDLDGLRSIITYDSDRSIADYFYKVISENDSLRISDIRFLQWKTGNSHATTLVRFDFRWRAPLLKSAGRETRIWGLSLVETRTGWKIQYIGDILNQVANQLTSVRTDEWVKAQVDSMRDVITPLMVREIDKWTIPFDEQGRHGESDWYNHAAALIAERMGYRGELARTLISRARVLMRRGEQPAALDACMRALQLLEDGNDPEALATLALLLADATRNSSDTVSPLRWYQLALRAIPAMELTPLRAEMGIETGSALLNAGAYGQALEAFHNAGGDYREMEGWGDEHYVDHPEYTLAQKIERATVGEARAHMAMGNLDEALAILTRSVEEERHKYRGPIAFPRSHALLGNLYTLLGRPRDALKSYHAALSRLDRLPHYPDSLELRQKLEAEMERDRAVVLNDLGALHRTLGNYADALRYLEIADTLIRNTDARELAGGIALNKGIIYQLTSQLDDALASYNKALAIADSSGNPRLRAEALLQLGNLYALRGDNERAIEIYRESLKLHKEGGNWFDAIATLSNIALRYKATGDIPKAIATYDEALTEARRLNYRIAEATALSNIGNLLLAMKDTMIVGELGDREEQTRSRLISAMNMLEKAIDIAEDMEDREGLIRSHLISGHIHEARGAWDDAAEAYSMGVEEVEQLRLAAEASVLQTGLFAEYREVYNRLAGTLLKLGRESDAFTVSEQGKGRTLAEIVSGSPPNPGFSQEEIEKERNLIARMKALGVKLARADRLSPKEVEDLRDALDDARDDYDRFLRDATLAHPRLPEQRAEFGPASLDSIGRILLANAPGRAILSYFVGEEETVLFLLKPGADGGAPLVRTFGIKTGRRDLARLAESFRLACATANGDKVPERSHRRTRAADITDYRTTGRTLYDLLVAPAVAELQEVTSLAILPDGPLHKLPFQALTDASGKHLVERYTITYAPSATILMKMALRANQKRSVRDTILLVGRPKLHDGSHDLPASEDEVKAIGALFGVAPHTNSYATENAVQSAAWYTRYVHIAAHGEINEMRPMYSAIRLALDYGGHGYDGRLEAWEIFRLNLNTDLVVLSACETALGAETNGEGILGLTWALFAAGSPVNVVSQWSVDDRSTSRLMVEFYRNFRTDAAMTKGEALRAAQLSLMADREYAHPYYWAPFVLSGAGW